MVPITFIRRMPAFVKGVINPRGKVDSGGGSEARVRMEEIDHTERSRIIIAKLKGGVTILLDIDGVLNSEEDAVLEKAA